MLILFLRDIKSCCSDLEVLLCAVQMVEMKPIEVEGKQRLTFIAPSRGLIGFRSASFVVLFAT